MDLTHSLSYSQVDGQVINCILKDVIFPWVIFKLFNFFNLDFF